MAAQRRYSLVRLGRLTATTALLVVAAAGVALIWQYYVTSPWTRDGRVRVLVANVAPQVSGQIVELDVSDNQIVHKGDVLYVIDTFDYQVALDAAKTQVKMRAADLQVKRIQAERRQSLSSLSTSVEEKQQFLGTATQAEAQFANAQVQLAQAEVNMKRTKVRSPVEGYVTNLLLRVGDYASSGTPNVAVIDSSSFWIDGYFEETKMGRICVGDAANAELMGYPQPIGGRVESVTRGISVADATSSTQGLPNVDPIYTWVRLAQRVPVRVRIVDVPKGVPLVSGMTATVRIADGMDVDGALAARAGRALDAILQSFRLRPWPVRDCGPAQDVLGVTTKLPIDVAEHPLSPEAINPGLAPAMNMVPQR
ncbi:HlyD family secretion protein [Beijerinckia sp. L45]|uniref:efflux RND transporter periplasmic adaptor subunit n=1 Tax=Beijerinckia sp. L45 TaxID=1641855 RepID=UPI00131E4E28|nr:HlyD family secretion protein [Beijerinckia sp. L45]